MALNVATVRAIIASMIEGSQIRAARALIDMSAKELASASGVSYASIQRAERSEGVPNMQSRNLNNVREALEGAGVAFIGRSPEGGPGVRLTR